MNPTTRILMTVTAWCAAALPHSARGAEGGPPPAPRPPNVVLIISDDHGWADYGFMGHPHVRTPHLDRLASQGLTFRRGYVPSSLCCPSLASIVTGLYPHQQKVTGNDPPVPAGLKRADPKYQPAFRAGREAMNRHLEAVPTLPRLLASKGYVSFQAGKWWQGDFSRGGFTHGMTKGQRHGDDGLAIGRQTMRPVYDFIESARKADKPFFVWYAPMMPHTPHNPPERLLDKYRDTAPSPHVARYWAMVEWFDETCGELLGHLDERGLAQDTVVVYVTDNGWIQDPAAAKFAPRSKQSPYDGGLRTPVIVRWPGRVKPRASDVPVSSLDIAPTLLAAAGLKPAADLPGVNLLDDAAVGARKAVFGGCFTHDVVDLTDPAASLRWRWVIETATGRKLILPVSQNEPGGKPELYDLARDPHEREDLAAQDPAAVERLTAALDEWWPGGGGGDGARRSPAERPDHPRP